MEKLLAKFKRIVIDPESWDSPVAQRLRSSMALSRIERRILSEDERKTGLMNADQFNLSKRNLFVTNYAGQFFKRCPGSRPGLVCCNYFVLNLGAQCDMNCSYCYLQSFLNSPWLTIYANFEKAKSELYQLNADLSQSRVRVGTGETIDSLSLDPLTLYSRELISIFRDFPNWLLEFKSKSSLVEQFLDCEHAGNVVVSWSLNPQWVIEREEHNTASLEERLKAAEACRDRKFPVAFHLDPMIYFDDWREHYGALVKEITARFRPTEVPFISVGALRFQPEQRHLMRQRFGYQSLVNQAEMFTSSDGKLRYDRSLRQEMYDFVLSAFKHESADWRVFLCMETNETWTRTTGTSPHQTPLIQDLFDTKVLRKFDQVQAGSL